MKKRKVQTYGKCANFIAAIFNYNIDCGKLLDVLKYADDKPVHKKNGECDKTNYGPVSILINILKLYENMM